MFGSCQTETQGEDWASDRHTFPSSVAADFCQQGHIFDLAWPRGDLKWTQILQSHLSDVMQSPCLG